MKNFEDTDSIEGIDALMQIAGTLTNALDIIEQVERQRQSNKTLDTNHMNTFIIQL